jgi:O-antigen ligase
MPESFPTLKQPLFYSMKSNSSLLFTVGLFLTAVAFSDSILDSTLLPRLAGFALFSFFILWLYFRKGEIQIKKAYSLKIYLAYVLFVWLSMFWCINFSEALLECSRVTLAFICFIIYLGLTSEEKVQLQNNMTWLSILLVLIGTVVAISQFAKVDFAVKETYYQLKGINGHKNLFASFLFLNLFFLSRKFENENKKQRWIRMLAIILSVTLIALLRTKAVYIGLTVTALLYFTLQIFPMLEQRVSLVKKLTITLITLFLFVGFIVWIAPTIIQRALTLNTEIAEGRSGVEFDGERLMLWQKTYGMFKKNPLIGTGAGNWQIHFPNETLEGMWRAEDLNVSFQRPHNDVLWILSETGIIGLTLFFAFIFSLLVRSFFIKNHQCFAWIIGFLVISFFDFPKERMEHLVWLNLILAMSYEQRNTENAAAFFSLKKTHITLMIILTSSIIFILAYRMKGEYYTRKLYEASLKREHFQTIEYSRKALSKVYSVDPTSIPVKWYSGNAFASIGNFQEAFISLKEAYKMNPYSRNVLNDLGSAYAKLGITDTAKALYTEAARISPRFDEAKLNLAALLIHDRNYQSADSCLNTLFHDSERRSQYQKIVDAFKNNN